MVAASTGAVAQMGVDTAAATATAAAAVATASVAASAAKLATTSANPMDNHQPG
jgi:hypothetical protein